jgi:hypothetical protein
MKVTVYFWGQDTFRAFCDKAIIAPTKEEKEEFKKENPTMDE